MLEDKWSAFSALSLQWTTVMPNSFKSRTILRNLRMSFAGSWSCDVPKRSLMICFRNQVTPTFATLLVAGRKWLLMQLVSTPTILQDNKVGAPNVAWFSYQTISKTHPTRGNEETMRFANFFLLSPPHRSPYLELQAQVASVSWRSSEKGPQPTCPRCHSAYSCPSGKPSKFLGSAERFSVK